MAECMLLQQALRALELAALIILENGGETYRVEETVQRMSVGFGYSNVNAVCTVTGLFLTLETDTEHLTVVRRVRRRGTNLWRVDAANVISRTVAAGQMSAAQAVQELIHIQRSYSVRNRMMFVCSGLTSGFFALMFAGGMMEFLLAFLCGVTVYLLSIRLRRMDMFLVMHSLLGGLICALFALIGRALFHTSLEAVIAGSLMPLLPGLAMTSAVRDTMRGDLLSGVTRGVEALLVAGLLATGVAIMLRVGLSLGGVA